MASSSSKRVPITTTFAMMSLGSRVLENPIIEELVEKRLKEAGFDEKRDNVVDLIAKLESEVADNKNIMDLLLLEKDKLLSKYEEVKATVDEANQAHRQAQSAAYLSALAEVKKREESLNKDVQIAKECISSLEKRLHEIDDHAEVATTRLAVTPVVKSSGQREKTLQEDILVRLPNVYPTVGDKRAKRAKTDKHESGSGSVQELKIHRDLEDEMDFTGRIPSSKPSFINSRKGHPCLLWDVRGKKPEGELASTNWRDDNRGGPVRNQGDHDNCWCYTSTDVYSSYRLRNGEDEDFRVMSSRYLTFYVSEAERKRVRNEKGRVNHQCHGFPVIDGLRFIKEHGVPEEDPLDATRNQSCVNDPPSRNQPLLRFGADVKFLESDKIEDLHKMLLHQAVSANMVLYNPEYKRIRTLNVVYEGPTSENSVYVGIHAVLVLAILMFEGKWVALVKLSHGTKFGAGGYMYISLTKMIMNVKFSASSNQISQLKDDTNEALAEPSYLLQKFTGVDYGDSQKSVGGTSKKRKLN